MGCSSSAEKSSLAPASRVASHCALVLSRPSTFLLEHPPALLQPRHPRVQLSLEFDPFEPVVLEHTSRHAVGTQGVELGVQSDDDVLPRLDLSAERLDLVDRLEQSFDTPEIGRNLVGPGRDVRGWYRYWRS